MEENQMVVVDLADEIWKKLEAKLAARDRYQADLEHLGGYIAANFPSFHGYSPVEAAIQLLEEVREGSSAVDRLSQYLNLNWHGIHGDDPVRTAIELLEGYQRKP